MLIADKAHVFYSPHKIVFGMGTAAGIGAEVKDLSASKVLIVTDPGSSKPACSRLSRAPLKKRSLPMSFTTRSKPSPRCDWWTRAPSGSGPKTAIWSWGWAAVHPWMWPKAFPSSPATGAAFWISPEWTWSRNPVRRKSSCRRPPGQARDHPGAGRHRRGGKHEEGRLQLLLPAGAGHRRPASDVFHAAFGDRGHRDGRPRARHRDLCLRSMRHPSRTSWPKRPSRGSGAICPSPGRKASTRRRRYYHVARGHRVRLAFASGGLGAVHGLSYVLGTRYHLPHGRSNAIMLPHVMKFNLPGAPEKYATIAALLGRSTPSCDLNQAAARSVGAVEDLLKTMQISYRLSDYGISEKEMPFLVEGGIKQSRLFSFNPRDLSEDNVRAVYQAAI